jgi:transposase
LPFLARNGYSENLISIFRSNADEPVSANGRMTMSRKSYPSDISREQFEPIRSLLEGARHKTRPRRDDLYDIFCAILYLLKNASVWRALPSDFPSVSTVRYYFDQWSGERAGQESSLLEQALKKSGGAGAQAQRTRQLDELLHRGRAKREEYRHRPEQRV